MKKILTSTEKKIIEYLNDPLYTINFLEEWINRTETIAVNAPAALQIMGALGYYQAVKRIAQFEGRRMKLEELLEMKKKYEQDFIFNEDYDDTHYLEAFIEEYGETLYEAMKELEKYLRQEVQQ